MKYSLCLKLFPLTCLIPVHQVKELYTEVLDPRSTWNCDDMLVFQTGEQVRTRDILWSAVAARLSTMKLNQKVKINAGSLLWKRSRLGDKSLIKVPWMGGHREWGWQGKVQLVLMKEFRKERSCSTCTSNKWYRRFRKHLGHEPGNFTLSEFLNWSHAGYQSNKR